MREKRDEILARAFKNGYRYAVKHIGKSIDKWRWGKVHTVEIRNATLGESGIGPVGRIFNRAPVGVQGDLSRSVSVHITGHSGHLANQHYDDFIERWRNVEYHPTLWEQEVIEKASRQRMRLLPLC